VVIVQYWCCASDYQPYLISKSMLPVPVQLTLINISLGYSAASTSSTKDMLTHYLPRLELHSTCCYNNWPFFSFVNLGDPCSILLVLPSPHTHNSLALHHRHIQGGHLHSICHLFLSFLLLKSNESDGGSISTVFLRSLHTNSDCKPNPQKHWTLHLDIYNL